MRRIPFNSVAQIYDRTRGPPKHVMRKLLETLTSELDGYRIVLDTGVGTGRFAGPLQDKGFEVVGIDIAKEMLNIAAEKNVGNLFLSDVCFLPFKDDSFDATICVHVLHLISEWKTALHEICRVTQGVLVSMFYAHKNPVREAYNRLLRKYGYESHRLGKGEWELRNMVKPSRSLSVTSYRTSVNKRLERLSQRAYSSQWDIPEEVNARVVNELKSQFAGSVFHQELRLLVWNINKVKAFCDKKVD